MFLSQSALLWTPTKAQGHLCVLCDEPAEKRLHVPASHGLLQSSLDDVSADMDDRVEVEVDWR